MAITSYKESVAPFGALTALLTHLLTDLRSALGRRRLALRRRRERRAAVRQLSRLDERMLKDIGLSRGELAPLLELWQARQAEAARWPQRWSD